LAGLLLSRLVYCIIPFALALLILRVREVVLKLHFARMLADAAALGAMATAAEKATLEQDRNSLDRSRNASAIAAPDGDARRLLSS